MYFLKIYLQVWGEALMIIQIQNMRRDYAGLSNRFCALHMEVLSSCSCIHMLMSHGNPQPIECVSFVW